MCKLQILVASLLLIIVTGQDQLGFVFEFVRHGARAPLIDDPGMFQVDQGMLTTTGMRERYLVGQMNREKYVKQWGLLDENFIPTQMYHQSTNVPRSLQSAYSEMLGLYPPGYGNVKLSEGERESLLSQKGLPPFKVKGAKYINSYLGLEAIKYGIVQIPVYTLTEITTKDDILFSNCELAKTMEQGTIHDPDTYASIQDPFFYYLKEPVSIIFNLTEEEQEALDFYDLYHYCDALISEWYEGDDLGYEFSEIQWYYVTVSGKYSLLMRFSDYVRQLIMTKLFRNPLKALDEKVKRILAGAERKEDLKYFLYSGHDDQFDQILAFLNPYQFDFHIVHVASQFNIDLHYDQKCLEEEKSIDCFWVEVFYNGIPLHFEPCVKKYEANMQDSKSCGYSDFVDYMHSVSIEGNLEELCDHEYVKGE